MATEYPDGIVIGYVNTYLNVKAESDYCCASANSAKVVLHVLEDSRPTQPRLLLPDVYLGFMRRNYWNNRSSLSTGSG